MKIRIGLVCLLALCLAGFDASAKDPKHIEHRAAETKKLSVDFAEQADKLGKQAELEADKEKAALLGKMSELKREESEALDKLSEAYRKKQWSSIKRYEKVCQDLCEKAGKEWENWKKLEEAKGKSGEICKPEDKAAPHPPGPGHDKSKLPLADPSVIEAQAQEFGR